MVVRKTLEAIAGSILLWPKIIGVVVPTNQATAIIITIAKAITPPASIAMHPFKLPTINSLLITRHAFVMVISFIASVLTATVKICVPAFPLIEATIDIKTAKQPFDQ